MDQKERQAGDRIAALLYGLELYFDDSIQLHETRIGELQQRTHLSSMESIEESVEGLHISILRTARADVLRIARLIDPERAREYEQIRRKAAELDSLRRLTRSMIRRGICGIHYTETKFGADMEKWFQDQRDRLKAEERAADAQE
jgi:hypothetical protein